VYIHYKFHYDNTSMKYDEGYFDDERKDLNRSEKEKMIQVEGENLRSFLFQVLRPQQNQS